MPVTPSGILSEPIDGLCDLIAGSSNFQTFVEAASAAAAKDRVYVVGSNPEDYLRPCALVSFVPGSRWNPVSLGPFGDLTLTAFFEADIDTDNIASHQDAFYGFSNPMGAILEDLANNSRTPGSLFVREITIVSGPQRCHQRRVNDDTQEVENFYQLVLQLQVGAR